MSDDNTYQRWIERRKQIDVPPGFADDTAQQAAQGAVDASAPGVLQAVASSPVASFAVCSAAMLIGLLPFMYVAYVARLISF